jgi:hypothetical protein
MKDMDLWLQSLVQQTLDHKSGVLLTVDNYIVSRRENSGLKLLFSLTRCKDDSSLIVLFSDAYKLGIPDQAMAHPEIASMEDVAENFKTWCNVGFLR